MLKQNKGTYRKLDLRKKKELINQNSVQIFNEQTNTIYKNYIQIFTDGARNAHGVGCAFWIPSINVVNRYKLSNFMSSYTSELIAIYRAVKYTCYIDVQNILICTDSLASVNALHSFAYKAEGNSLVVSIIHDIVNSDKNIVILWIPGHVGIVHNEIVDKIARESISVGEDDLEINVPTNDFNSYLKKNLILNFETQLQTTPKALWYKTIESKFPKYKWFSNTKWSRQDIIYILRLRFGHARTNACLFKINQYFTPLCLKCTLSEQETLDHLILKCPTYQYARDRCFKLIEYRNMSLLDILKTTRLDLYLEIIKFIKYTKITI